jgi:DNA-directed RNA polymerase specialized sigma24 family protein
MANGAGAGVLVKFRDPGAREITDGQLLERFACRHEQAAFAALVRRHGPLVLTVCQRVLGDRHDADDAFQATFLLLARKAGTMTWQDSVDNWLYAVAQRLALHAKSARTPPESRAVDRQLVQG